MLHRDVHTRRLPALSSLYVKYNNRFSAIIFT